MNEVFSNMAIKRIVNNTNNESWTHFYTTYQMPIYLVKAAIMTNFSKITERNITIWCRGNIISDIRHAFSITERVITYLQFNETLEKKWKNINIARNYIAIPNFQNKGQVNLKVNVYK